MKIPIPFASLALVIRVEPHPRKPIRIRPRVSVRALMIGVAVVTLGFGGYLARERSEERRLFRYFDETERRLLGEAERAEGQGRSVDAAKARFFAGEAARERTHYRP